MGPDASLLADLTGLSDLDSARLLQLVLVAAPFARGLVRLCGPGN